METAGGLTEQEFAVNWPHNMKNTSPRIVGLTTLQFQSWLASANKIFEDHRQVTCPNLPKESLIPSEGERYIKITRVREGQVAGNVYGFIDRTNGDILRAASWRAPAKHARGNLFSPDNGLTCVGPYGIAYLRR